MKNDSGAMQMQPKADGFTVPAGGTHVLQPGGDHVMLMGLDGPPRERHHDDAHPGDHRRGRRPPTVPVRAFPGAAESYAPSPSHS